MSATDHLPSKVFQALWAGGITAATFDFFAAQLIYKGSASGVAKAVAKGWYGPAVKTMPWPVDAVGMASHYAILLIAAALFVGASLRLPVLRARAWITGPLFGVGIYVVMHYVVLPLSAAGSGNPVGVQFAEEFLGHLFLIGLPIALWARAILGRD